MTYLEYSQLGYVRDHWCHRCCQFGPVDVISCLSGSVELTLRYTMPDICCRHRRHECNSGINQYIPAAAMPPIMLDWWCRQFTATSNTVAHGQYSFVLVRRVLYSVSYCINVFSIVSYRIACMKGSIVPTLVKSSKVTIFTTFIRDYWQLWMKSNIPHNLNPLHSKIVLYITWCIKITTEYLSFQFILHQLCSWLYLFDGRLCFWLGIKIWWRTNVIIVTVIHLCYGRSDSRRW